MHHADGDVVHPSQRLSEDLVTCSVDERIDAEVDEAEHCEYVEPFIRQSSALFTVLRS